MVDFGLLCRCLPVRTAELCGGCNARCARFARSADGLTAHTQYRLQSVKAGTQAFGKTAVQTGAELRSSGWFAAENPVLILVFIWCLWCKNRGRSRMGSALLLCLLFDRVKNILQDLGGGLICRLDGVCVNLTGGG